MPTHTFARLRARLGQRADSEHRQVVMRMALTALFCTYFGWHSVETGHEGTLRVLIADDHATNRKVLQSLLEAAGHRVTAVEDGHPFSQSACIRWGCVER